LANTRFNLINPVVTHFAGTTMQNARQSFATLRTDLKVKRKCSTDPAGAKKIALYKMENKMKFKEFMENCSPYQKCDIDDINIVSENSITPNKTDIFIHRDSCDGNRYFRMTNNKTFMESNEIYSYIFKCRNCETTQKIITVLGSRRTFAEGYLTKIGEYPPYGKPTPAKFISMIGPDKEIFLKGRRCENQSLGIGAFSYYRRVVELQKNRIIDQIISICNKYENMETLIKELEHAKEEIQF
jgi:hypothetical protein